MTRAGDARRGLGNEDDGRRLGQEDTRQQEVDELGWGREQLDEQRRPERAARRAPHRAHGVGDRSPPRVQVDERGADRSDGGARGQPLDDARGQQHG